MDDRFFTGLLSCPVTPVLSPTDPCTLPVNIEGGETPFMTETTAITFANKRCIRYVIPAADHPRDLEGT